MASAPTLTITVKQDPSIAVILAALELLARLDDLAKREPAFLAVHPDIDTACETLTSALETAAANIETIEE